MKMRRWAPSCPVFSVSLSPDDRYTEDDDDDWPVASQGPEVYEAEKSQNNEEGAAHECALVVAPVLRLLVDRYSSDN